MANLIAAIGPVGTDKGLGRELQLPRTHNRRQANGSGAVCAAKQRFATRHELGAEGVGERRKLRGNYKLRGNCDVCPHAGSACNLPAAPPVPSLRGVKTDVLARKTPHAAWRQYDTRFRLGQGTTEGNLIPGHTARRAGKGLGRECHSARAHDRLSRMGQGLFALRLERCAAASRSRAQRFAGQQALRRRLVMPPAEPS